MTFDSEKREIQVNTSSGARDVKNVIESIDVRLKVIQKNLEELLEITDEYEVSTMQDVMDSVMHSSKNEISYIRMLDNIKSRRENWKKMKVKVALVPKTVTIEMTEDECGECSFRQTLPHAPHAEYCNLFETGKIPERRVSKCIKKFGGSNK